MSDPMQALLDRAVGSYVPFPPESRYYGLPICRQTTADGREISFVGRRFVPPASAHAQVAEHVVVRGDRLDTIAAAHVGNSELFWRVCDANDAIRPADLVATPGTRLRIALPPGVPAPRI